MTVFETVYIVLILKQVPCKNCKDLKEIYRIDKKKLQEICRKSKRNKQYVFYGLENNRSSKLIKDTLIITVTEKFKRKNGCPVTYRSASVL